jgi:hypothetical protein
MYFFQIAFGPGKVSTWANLITLVTMPGPAILDALRMVQQEQNVSVGAVIIAEMSSKGKLNLPIIMKSFN